VKLLRSLEDCRDILAVAQAAQHIAVVGGSFIGSRPPLRYVTVGIGYPWSPPRSRWRTSSDRSLPS
jgi:hypothetical protein